MKIAAVIGSESSVYRGLVDSDNDTNCTMPHDLRSDRLWNTGRALLLSAFCCWQCSASWRRHVVVVSAFSVGVVAIPRSTKKRVSSRTVVILNQNQKMSATSRC